MHLRTLGTYFWPFLACLRIARPHSFSLTNNSTTTTSSAQCPIDQEFVQSLIGICLQVPQSGWPGYSSSELYAGAVQELDFSDEQGRYFLFEGDGDVGSRYPMLYDAFLHYANKEQLGYARFRLPPNPPANMANEAVRLVRRNAQQRRQKRQ